MLYKTSRIPKCFLAWIHEKGAHLTGVSKQATEVCSKQLASRTPKCLQGVYMTVGLTWMRIFPENVKVAQ